ncbi:MAG: hypothetical protein ACE5HW_04920, partial [Candidatus Methanofastidiosia archaeon]
MSLLSQLLRKDRLKGIFGLFLVWVILFIIFSPVLDEGVASGSDAMGHLFKVWYIGEHFKMYNHIPSWTPYWYTGFPLLKFYPPFSYYIISIMFLFIDDIDLTYRVFTFFIVFSLSASFY